MRVYVFTRQLSKNKEEYLYNFGYSDHLSKAMFIKFITVDITFVLQKSN